MKRLLLIAALCCGIGLQGTAVAQTASGGAGDTGGKIVVDEQTGVTLPLDAEFVDENDLPVTLGGLIELPTILLPIYFYCPNSCSTNLANLAVGLGRMKLEAGTDYQVIALSFNHLETPETARNAKANYLKLLPDDFPQDQWRFLTGSEAQIKDVLDTIGFTFKPLEDGTFIHPSALVSVSADGRVIKYVYGNFIAGDIELAVAEAARGAPATSIKRFLNYCFNYDPDTNKSFFQGVKIVILTLFGGLILLFFARFIWRRRESTE